MEEMTSKTVMRIIGIGASALLTIFAGLFALTAIGAAVVAVADKCFISAIGAAAMGYIAYVCWGVRRDVL